jgi:Insect cuticle protein
LTKPRAKQVNRVDEDYPEVADPIKSSSSNHDKKQYRFSYAVKDGNSGDDFSHTQKQENGAVQGSYSVQLPDGRVQIVKYTADDIHGYRAEVSYEGTAHVEPDHPRPTPVVRHQPQIHYPQLQQQVEVQNIRHTVTPTPYQSQYNIRAPPSLNYYAPTTVNPRHYY